MLTPVKVCDVSPPPTHKSLNLAHSPQKREPPSQSWPTTDMDGYWTVKSHQPTKVSLENYRNQNCSWSSRKFWNSEH